MRTVIVDMDRWYRGKGAEESKLKQVNGEMCCLGFVCEAEGIENFRVATPGEVSEPKGLVCNLIEDNKRNTAEAKLLMFLNDLEINTEKDILNAGFNPDIRNLMTKLGLTNNNKFSISSDKERRQLLNKVCNSCPNLGFQFDFVQGE